MAVQTLVVKDSVRGAKAVQRQGFKQRSGPDIEIGPKEIIAAYAGPAEVSRAGSIVARQ